ncbi:uncharacterized protein LOC126672638 [Mercurialis annua]|uniref:uncharacterized protein LOC126672638 n=1 Tax=Mercurialis annua TaxID=3986 RepID=UPI00215E002C|nr:uncharacterized protein LOC126672638 [Mercurialis annua]
MGRVERGWGKEGTEGMWKVFSLSMEGSQKQRSSGGKTLTLIQEEAVEVVLDVGDSCEIAESVKFCLYGKLLTTKPVNVEARPRTFNAIWKLNKDFRIKSWPDNVFVFQFYSDRDKERVVEGSPWTFDSHLLVLIEVNAEISPAEVCFDSAPFWVRVFNIPLGRLTKESALVIGGKIGQNEKPDVGSLYGWRRYLRIRVELDITKPLKRGIMLKDVHNQSRWLDFQYERLGIFCYICGKIGHQDSDCEWVDNFSNKEDYKYGGALRTLSLKPINKVQKLEQAKEEMLIKAIQRKFNFNDENSNTGNMGKDKPVREEDVDHDKDEETCMRREEITDSTEGMPRTVSNLRPLESRVAMMGLNFVHSKCVSTATGCESSRRKWKKAARVVSTSNVPKQTVPGKRKMDRGINDGCSIMAIDEGIVTKKGREGTSMESELISANSDVHQCYSPDLIFISETKSDKAKIGRIFNNFWYNNFIAVDSVRNSGGLVLAWKDAMNVVMGIQKKLENINRGSSCGKFNEILWQHERSGSRLREERKMQVLRSVLCDCGLVDLIQSGSKFSWFRGNGDRDPILERLDRLVGNYDWNNIFPLAVVFTLLRESLYLAPLLLDTDPNNKPADRNRKRIQRFEAIWVSRPDCEEVIRDICGVIGAS